jgi:hypothetical protein
VVGQTLAAHPAPMAKAIAFATVPRSHPAQPGAKAPGQRTPRQWRALSHPPGPALASRFADGTGPRAGVPHGRGNAVRFLAPPGPAEGQTLAAHPAPMAKAIAFATVPRSHPVQPGAKAPGQRPSRPKAGASHPPGRALASRFADGTGPRGSVPHGRGNAVRFLGPPGPAGRAHGRVSRCGGRSGPPTATRRRGCCDPPVRAARQKAGPRRPGQRGFGGQRFRPRGRARRCAASPRPSHPFTIGPGRRRQSHPPQSLPNP